MSIIEAPSQDTLNEIPGRTFTFMMAVAQVPAIGATLAVKGYSLEEHNFAWERLSKLAVVGGPASSPLYDKTVRDAVIELDAWDNVNLPIIKAALARNHEKQAVFLLQDLSPKDGQESVLVVATLLRRMKTLEQSSDEGDLKALAVLASRGTTSDERDRLQALVDLASQVQLPDPNAKAPLSAEERQQILVELYGWFQEWSTVARKLIKRRDHMIRLGIAKRRQSKETPAEGNGEAQEKVAAAATATIAAAAAAAATANGAGSHCPPQADSASS